MLGSVISNCIFSDTYQTNSPENCLFQVRDSKSKVIVCDTYRRLKEKFLDKYEDELAEAGVKVAILFGEGMTSNTTGSSIRSGKIKVINWSQVVQLGSDVEDKVILRKMSK